MTVCSVLCFQENSLSYLRIWFYCILVFPYVSVSVSDPSVSCKHSLTEPFLYIMLSALKHSSVSEVLNQYVTVIIHTVKYSIIQYHNKTIFNPVVQQQSRKMKAGREKAEKGAVSDQSYSGDTD